MIENNGANNQTAQKPIVLSKSILCGSFFVVKIISLGYIFTFFPETERERNLRIFPVKFFHIFTNRLHFTLMVVTTVFNSSQRI